MRISPQFKKEIFHFFEESKLNMCYQCGKCASFCPVFHNFPKKFNPRKIIEMANIGIESIIEGPEIWRCTTCYECVENCPQKVNFVELIYALRNIAIKKGYGPKEVLDEIEAIKKYGHILSVTERIKKMREGIGTSPEIFDKGEILKRIFNKTGGK
jgi:heterodisulfide reductase subunit C